MRTILQWKNPASLVLITVYEDKIYKIEVDESGKLT